MSACRSCFPGPRIAWMPKHLKDEVEERLRRQLEKAGMPELFDLIATEEDAEDPEALLAYLEKVKHPALEMDPMF